MTEAEPATTTFFPRLSVAEWLTFAVLAAVLSVTNIYTTLLTGWGDGGSIIAVLASVLILKVFSRQMAGLQVLNLGQTMVSAGGTMGFSVCAYAAVRMLEPDWKPNLAVMVIMFAAMGVLAAQVGASVRKYMVKYFFPSGTACAVIQRSVTAEGDEAKRPVRMLAIWGSLSSLLTIPVKITFKKGGGALLHDLSFGSGYGLAVEPLLYGIGIVVGPRIGLGMILGALSGMLLIKPNVAPEVAGDWIKWAAIAVLTLPTFATIGFAYLFRTPAVIPSGFDPGHVEHPRYAKERQVHGVLGFAALITTAITAQMLFDLSWVATALTVAVSWPLCVMNGRVTGDTDINPVRLVAIVLLTVFAWFVSGGAIALLGMAIIGGTLAGMAVDMMQDFRTGFLVDANPAHQTSVQLVGSLIGALVAVPFIVFIDAKLGFGEGSALPAPGAQIWSAMAKAFAGDQAFDSALIWAIVGISVAGSMYAWFTVWPKTAGVMPSLFGAGIGLLLPFSMSAAIFMGGMINFVARRVYGAARQEEAGNDMMLVGSSVFAASAVVSVVAVLATELMSQLGLQWFFLAH